MKNIILTSITLLAMGMVLAINPTFAADRVKVYELAESGVAIEYKMTPEEIAAEDAENAKLAVLREANNSNSEKRVNVFEMGESGQTITFQLTADEIAAEDAENARRAAARKSKSTEQKKQVITYELAESGVSIEFPVETSAELVTEALAEKKSTDDSLN